MRKLLSIVCCTIVLLSASSCTKQYITPNPNRTVIANLTSSSWVVSNDNTAYQASIDVNALAANLTQYGGVVVSISYDGGITYEQVPEVYNSVSFSYTYNQGNVTIYAQTANGVLPPPSTVADPIKVKIVLVNSN